VAYVDSSCVTAVAFAEPGFRDVMARLSRFHLISSNLLEAELLSSMAREEIAGNPGSLLAWIQWVLPKRTLSQELRKVLEIKAPRGADLWHLACALYMRRKFPDLAFLTLDRNQGDVAKELGFPTS
jgi:PIN domain nuclease of toxin-antitoxin system